MLNREECDNALTRLLRPYFAKVDVQNVYHSINEGHSIEDDSNLLTLLIMEYFDNPPLKFEELKEGMWVWDNKYKYYFECNPRISTDMAKCVWYESFWYNTGEGYDEFYEDYIEFEENRFYRKEVQE